MIVLSDHWQRWNSTEKLLMKRTISTVLIAKNAQKSVQEPTRAISYHPKVGALRKVEGLTQTTSAHRDMRFCLVSRWSSWPKSSWGTELIRLFTTSSADTDDGWQVRHAFRETTYLKRYNVKKLRCEDSRCVETDSTPDVQHFSGDQLNMIYNEKRSLDEDLEHWSALFDATFSMQNETVKFNNHLSFQSRPAGSICKAFPVGVIPTCLGRYSIFISTSNGP